MILADNKDKEKSNKNKLDFLIKAIDDTQNTIRFSDSKAIAVIGFWTFLITIFSRTHDWWLSLFNNISHWTELVFLVILFILMMQSLIRSIWLSYLTLVPRSNPSDHIEKSNVVTKNLFYLFGYNQSLPLESKYIYQNHSNLKLTKTTREYIDELDSLDDEGLQTELVYELQKVSFIRNLKIDRVNVAIGYVIKFLIILGILLLFTYGKKVIASIGGVELFDFNFDPALFIVLYIGHKIADYLFQTDYQAVNKTKEWTPLLTHCLIYTVTVLGLVFITLGFFNWLAVIILFVSHVFIDRRNFIVWWAKKVKKIENTEGANVKLALFELDQAFHYIILFFISFM